MAEEMQHNADHAGTLIREVFDEAADVASNHREQLVRARLSDHPELIDRALRLVGAMDSGALNPLISIEVDDALEEGLSEALAAGSVVGTPLGDATITEVMSAGPRTHVYRAELRTPVRSVALKLFVGTPLDREHMRRFRAEARMHGLLNHPGIIPLLAYGSCDLPSGHSVLCLITPYIEGQQLDEWARNANPSPRKAATIIADVAKAVHHAHLRGVVHRDLKPANIIVDADGCPRVLDLGVARFLHGAKLKPEDTLSTRAQAVVGTPAYMAPEQVADDDRVVDLQTDVYALGVVLYELLSGELPVEVEGLSRSKLIERKRTARPRPPALPAADQQIAVAVAIALEPSRTARYDSCDEFARDLELAAQGLPILRRPPNQWQRVKLWARRDPMLAGMIGITVTAVVVGSGLAVASAIHADGQQQRAERMFEGTQDFAEWVLWEHDADLASLSGTSVARRKLIARAASALDALRLEKGAPVDLVVRVARARLRLADVLHEQLGDIAGADEQLRGALEVLSFYHQSDSPEVRLLSIEAILHPSYVRPGMSREQSHQLGYRNRLSSEPILADIAEANPGDQHLWIVLSKCRWSLGRLEQDLRGDHSRAMYWANRAIEAGRRAVEIDTENPDAVDNLIRALRCRAETFLDVKDEAVFSAMDDMRPWLTRLEVLRDPRAPLRRAELVSMEMTAKCQQGRHDLALDTAHEVVSMADALCVADPLNFQHRRFAEVTRAQAAQLYLDACKDDASPPAPGPWLTYIEQAEAMLAHRSGLGEVTPVEERYAAKYARLREQLERLAHASANG